MGQNSRYGNSRALFKRSRAVKGYAGGIRLRRHGICIFVANHNACPLISADVVHVIRQRRSIQVLGASVGHYHACADARRACAQPESLFGVGVNVYKHGIRLNPALFIGKGNQLPVDVLIHPNRRAICAVIAVVADIQIFAAVLHTLAGQHIKDIVFNHLAIARHSKVRTVVNRVVIKLHAALACGANTAHVIVTSGVVVYREAVAHPVVAAVIGAAIIAVAHKAHVIMRIDVLIAAGFGFIIKVHRHTVGNVLLAGYFAVRNNAFLATPIPYRCQRRVFPTFGRINHRAVAHHHAAGFAKHYRFAPQIPKAAVFNYNILVSGIGLSC